MADLDSASPNAAPANLANLAEPTQQALLAQLHDIQLPDPVSWWPLANSIWAVIVGVLGVIVGLTWYYWVRHQNNRYRREALALLQPTLAQHPEPAAKLMALNHLLKQVAITHYGRQRVAPLTGQAWIDFLQETAIYIDQPDNLADLMAASYQTQPISAEQLAGVIDYAQAWMKGHHK